LAETEVKSARKAAAAAIEVV